MDPCSLIRALIVYVCVDNNRRTHLLARGGCEVILSVWMFLCLLSNTLCETVLILLYESVYREENAYLLYTQWVQYPPPPNPPHTLVPV